MPDLRRASTGLPAVAQGILALLPILMLALSSPLPLESQSVSGRLLEHRTDRPLPWGRVALLTAEWERIRVTMSDEEGRFFLEAPFSGEFYLRADYLGFRSLVDGPLPVARGDTLHIDFRLEPSPIILDSLIVQVPSARVHLEAVGFYERERRGFGTFLDRREIERRRPLMMTDLFFGMPGVRLVRAGSSYVITTRSAPVVGLGSRFGCFPQLYLDGLPMSSDDEPFMIDNLLTPDHVEAVEVYANGSQAPAQYGGFGSSCGVVLIWTRR